MQTATTDPLVGRRLEGRYRLLDRIARGGMSTVYAAVDERLDRLVAVKVMNAHLSADPAFSDRFAREARAAARLTHLNVVSVYDQGHEIASDGHHVFLVMELVEGRTLRDLIHERGRLTPAEAVSIMEPVLSALSAAHRAGLVHRDIKPENILLSDEGVVKVADFGLARAVETDTSSTRTGLMMGTVAYCSPEQLSRGNADPRSDVYSAGIVFFELLTGQPPYRGESAMNIAYQHVHSRVPAPSSRVRGIPSEIDEIVVAATDTDPAARPSDSGALLAELADVRQQLALPVVPVPPRHRPRRATRPEVRPDQRDTSPTQRRPSEHTTTAVPRGGPVRHDTVIAPEGTPSRADRMDARDAALPPPVVIPPPKQRGAVNPRKRRRRRALLTVLLVLVLALGSFFGARAIIAWRFAHIPDVHGESQASAVSALRKAGYRVVVNPGAEYSDSVRHGLVLDTDPRGGKRLATGKTVTVTLSAGPHRYLIPNVRNESFDAAQSKLISVGGLTVAKRPTQRYDDTVPANKVIETEPKAGSRIRTGHTVTIVVSKGPPFVSVPSIAPGTSYGDARRALHGAHLSIEKNYQYNDTVTEGDVIGVDPSDRARKFSTVTVTISKGPRTVVVPDIPTYSSASDAVTTLKAAGLDPVTEEVSVGGGPSGGAVPPDAIVISVSPRPGTSVYVGTKIVVKTF